MSCTPRPGPAPWRCSRLKITVVRTGVGSRFLPLIGVTLFALLALTWFTVTPDFLAGED